MIRLVIAMLLFASTSFAAAWPATELECLAANVYHEARGEPLKGQFMVAYVTINRVKNSNYPNTICGVVKQPMQFSWFNPKKVKKPDDVERWIKSKRVARITLNKSYQAIKIASRGALFYHAVYVKPWWRKDLQYVTKIDNHIFYR